MYKALVRMDFTLTIYKKLVICLKTQDYCFITCRDYQNASLLTPFSSLCILRHDVDRIAKNALKMAQLEHSFGIRGTYYFRVVPESYDLEVMNKIAEMGHEIGYHYGDVSLVSSRQYAVGRGQRSEVRGQRSEVRSQRSEVRGQRAEVRNQNKELDREKLIDAAYESFCGNLGILRRNFDIKTICMHGSPWSKYDNRMIWEKYDYRELGIIGEPYFDIDFSEVLYLTDTGRRWDGDAVNVRDKVGLSIDDCRLTKGLTIDDSRLTNEKNMTMNEKLGLRFRGTQDIIDAAKSGLLPDKMMITVHPQRWTNNPFLWTKELVWQNVKNVGKRIIVKNFKERVTSFKGE